MATVAVAPKRAALAPDTYERALAVGACLLMLAVFAALARGRAEWHLVPTTVWLHLSTIMVALVLTPVMLLRRRGDPLHRQLGWVWCAAMLLTALLSFLLRNANHGNLSFIHILSAWVLIQVPLIVSAARKHNIKAHRTRVRAMVTGALLVAGCFTFPFNRLLGHWLIG